MSSELDFLYVKDVLSPTDVVNSASKAARMAGRFGYQICADAFSYALNIPQRLLLLDQIENLPKLYYDLLQDASMQEVIRRELEIKEMPTWFHDATKIERYLNQSYTQLEQISNKAKDLALNFTKNIEIHSSPDFINDEDWWKILLLMIPYVDQKIWLTDASAPIPIHAVIRFYDIWLAYIMLWSYNHLTEGKLKEEGELMPLYGIDNCVYRAWMRGWDASCSKSNLKHKVIILFGPFTIEGKDNNIECYPKLFYEYMNLASTNISGWTSHNFATPQMEELNDLLKLRLPSPQQDCESRKTLIQESWLTLFEIKIPKVLAKKLTRNDWEYLATSAHWLAKWKKLVTQNKLNLAKPKNNKWAINFPGWQYSVEIDCKNFDAYISNSLSNDSQDILGIIRYLKEKSYGIDYPYTLLNRIGERQMSNWSLQIMGINNLVHRYSLSSSPRKKLQYRKELPDLLHGAESQFCRYLRSMTHAHNINIYWLDYSEFPAHLKLLEGYSRFLEHEVNREKIFESFDRTAYSFDDKSFSCWQRGAAKSHGYRVAAENHADILKESSDGLWSGYEELFAHIKELIPQSGLAIPLRQNGKVVGVIELNGLVANQFSEQLLAPLIRATNLMGSFLYSNLLLHQLSEINKWVVSEDYFTLEESENPLMELTKLLTNVFLSPMVHIWLTTQDSQIYELYGNHVNSFLDDIKSLKTEIIGKLWFKIVKDSDFSPKDSFASTAVNLWKTMSVSKASPPWGKFCKAKFCPELESNEKHTIKQAYTTGVKLDKKYFAENQPWTEERLTLYKYGLNNLMVFPIVKSIPELDLDYYDEDLVVFETKNSGSKKTEKYKIIGVVTFLDHGDSKAEQADEIVSAYSTSWEPTIEYFQSYLTTLFEQLNLVSTSFQKARNIIMHQAIHELNEVNRRLLKRGRQLHFIFEGGGYDALQRVIRSNTSVEPNSFQWEELKKLFDAIIATKASTDYIEEGGFKKRLGIMTEQLKVIKHYSHFTFDPNQATSMVSLYQELKSELINHDPGNQQAGRHVEFIGFRSDREYKIIIIKSSWYRLLFNLFENMSKYSHPHSTWNIELKHKRLTLQNVGDVNPGETAAILMKYGARGKSAKNKGIDGEGIGLMDAKLAAKYLGIEFNYDIKPFASQNRAYHVYTLDLSNVLTIEKF
jgi:hypothetical protein